MSDKTFMKETAVWETREGKPNKFGNFQHSTKEIKCKIEEERGIVVTPQGEQSYKYSRLFTLEAVEEGDKINGLTIMSVKPIKDGKRIRFYEVIAK